MLRPRFSAMERMLAIASLRTFLPSVPPMSSPELEIGDAAPMFVPDAISAICPARVMNVPALAARAPAGATQTIVGTLASSSAVTMRCVASRLPPGVLRRITTAGAFARVAAAMPSSR